MLSVKDDDGYWSHDIGRSLVGGPSVTVRVEVREGRVVTTDLILHSDEGITSTDLRDLSLPSIEARTQGRITHRNGIWQGDPTFDELRAAWRSGEESVAVGRNMARQAGREHRPRLSRPSDMDLDADDFYQLVARAYREYAQETRAAAKKIAEEAEVPVTTAHRWVREARRRDFLPPGRQGRAG